MAGAFTVPASVVVGKNAQRCCVQSQTQARCASFLRSGLHAASTRTVEFKRSVHGPAVLRMADRLLRQPFKFCHSTMGET